MSCKRRRLPELPEAMIQHIQSYMSGKEAARTALLSKSWRNAWLYRPRVDLDERDVGKIEKFATKAMRRYQKLGLKIESFRLCGRYSYYSSLKMEKRDVFFRRLIVEAIKIGASDLEIEMPPHPSASLTLPKEVLASQTLVRLSVTRCSLDGSSYAVRCSSLKSLALDSVKFTSDGDGDGDVLGSILTSCRDSMEELSVSAVCGSRLKALQRQELHKLRRLFLRRVEVDVSMFSEGFASRFPCLEELSILECSGCTRIRIAIASTSLQTIRFKPLMDVAWSAEFDVPNIRKFSYSGWCLPSSKKLSIKAADSRVWKFDVSLRCNELYDREWFLMLKKYLIEYRLSSRISLSISCSRWLGLSRAPATADEVQDDVDVDVDVEDVPAEPPLVLDNLIIDAPSSYISPLLNRLFRICRPKSMTHNLLYQHQDNYGFLCKRKKRRVWTAA